MRTLLIAVAMVVGLAGCSGDARTAACDRWCAARDACGTGLGDGCVDACLARDPSDPRPTCEAEHAAMVGCWAEQLEVACGETCPTEEAAFYDCRGTL